MNIHYNSKEFWMIVKSDYVHPHRWICKSSILFSNAFLFSNDFDKEEFRAYLLKFAQEFLEENKRYENYEILSSGCLFYSNFPHSFTEYREIRVDFIDYMINKLSH